MNAVRIRTLSPLHSTARTSELRTDGNAIRPRLLVRTRGRRLTELRRLVRAHLLPCLPERVEAEATLVRSTLDTYGLAPRQNRLVDEVRIGDTVTG